TGGRVHLEFSPQERKDSKRGQSSDLHIHAIVEQDYAPKTPHYLNLEGVHAFDALSVDTEPEQAASRFASEFQQAAYIVSPESSSCWSASGEACNWMRRHPELWSTPSAEAAAKVEPFFKRQAELLAQMKRTSHTAPVAWDGDGVDEHVLVRGNHATPG